MTQTPQWSKLHLWSLRHFPTNIGQVFCTVFSIGQCCITDQLWHRQNDLNLNKEKMFNFSRQIYLMALCNLFPIQHRFLTNIEQYPNNKMVQHLVICLKSLAIQCCEQNIMYTSKTFDLEVFVTLMKYMKYSNHVSAH